MQTELTGSPDRVCRISGYSGQEMSGSTGQEFSVRYQGWFFSLFMACHKEPFLVKTDCEGELWAIFGWTWPGD